MSDSSKQLPAVLEAMHHQLAAFGKESYELEGRGVIRMRLPDLPPGTTTAVSTEMVYHTLAQVHELTANLQGDSRDDADVLLRMIETYDPAKQAVVTLAFATGNPITVKMRLERPFVLDEAPGLH